jgi:CRP-like cAMP-binding protein
MSKSAKPQRSVENRLLAALPNGSYRRLFPNLECGSFSLGRTLYEPGEHLEYIYFPTSCIVSLLYTMENGATAEMGLTGNEGAVGIALFMGGMTTPNRAVVQVAGDSVMLKTKILQDEFERGGPLQQLLLRYTQALITQISQTAVCNRLHPLEKRLCRWLLLIRDRVESDELRMTQEFLSNMLGVRREGVTYAAHRLREKGFVRYARGQIIIRNRRGLEDSACECYRVVKNEYDRLLGRVLAS